MILLLKRLILLAPSSPFVSLDHVCFRGFDLTLATIKFRGGTVSSRFQIHGGVHHKLQVRIATVLLPFAALILLAAELFTRDKGATAGEFNLLPLKARQDTSLGCRQFLLVQSPVFLVIAAVEGK